MSVPIAALGHLGLRKEESFASGGAVADYQPIFSEDLQMNKAYYYGSLVMASAQQVGGRIMQQNVTGAVVFPISPSNPEEWWQCGIGGSSSPYSPARPLKSMLIVVDRETGDILTSGDMIASLEISSAAGGPLQCTASIEGKGFQDHTAGSASYTSGDDPYLHNEGVFELDDVATSDIMSFAVNVNNNLITDLYANQKERRDIPASMAVVTGNFTKLFQDTDTRNKFLQELPVKIEATYSRGAKSFKIALNSVRFDNTTEPLSGQTDYISETFNFTGYITDTATENVITVTIV